MSYNSNRISEQLRVLQPEIYNFIVRYNASNGPGTVASGKPCSSFPGEWPHASCAQRRSTTPGVVKPDVCL